MSARQAVDDLTGESAFGEAARAIVWARFKTMWKHRDGTAAGDAEALHDMRVGSRRLRAALEMAAPAFPGREHTRFLRLTRRLTSELGAVRDEDVLLARLDTLAAAGGPGAAAGVATLRPLVAAQRLVEADALLAFFDHLDTTGYAELAARLWHRA